MYPLIQDVAKFRSICEKYKMDFYPELATISVIRDVLVINLPDNNEQEEMDILENLMFEISWSIIAKLNKSMSLAVQGNHFNS